MAARIHVYINTRVYRHAIRRITRDEHSSLNICERKHGSPKGEKQQQGTRIPREAVYNKVKFGTQHKSKNNGQDKDLNSVQQ